MTSAAIFQGARESKLNGPDLTGAPIAARGRLSVIPLINLASPREAVVLAVADACAQWGFFQIMGVRGERYFSIAERIIAARAISPLSTLPTLKPAPDIARKVHPREPVAWKIIMALLQLVRDIEMLAIAERRQRLRHPREQVESEITILTALLRSAKDGRGIAELTGLLAAQNAASEKPSKVVDPESRRAFA